MLLISDYQNRSAPEKSHLRSVINFSLKKKEKIKLNPNFFSRHAQEHSGSGGRHETLHENEKKEVSYLVQ